MKNQVKKRRGFFSSISGKIILAIIGTNLIVLLLIAGVIGFMLSQNVGGLSEDFAIQQVQSYANLFEKEFSDIETAVKMLSNQMAMVTDVNKAKANPSYLKEIQEEYAPIIQHIGNEVGITRSIYVYYNIEMFKGEYDIWFYNDGNGFERQPALGLEYYEGYNEWYNEPIDQGRSLWSFPYVSETGGLITSFVTPIIKDGERIGVVGMDLYLDDIQKQLVDTRLFDSGYLYLITEDGDIIYHPNHPWSDDGTPSNLLQDTDNTEVYEKLLADMKSNTSLFTSYRRDDGQEVVAAFTHLRNGWVLSSSIPTSEVMKIVNGVLLILVGITAVTIVIAFVIAVIVGKTISRPILQVVKATEIIKEGDFTVEVQSKSKDETRLLADALNAMTRNVQNLIREAKIVSKEMVDSASGLAAITQETNATVEQVASTVGEIAKGTQDTASSAEKGAIATQIIDQKFASLMENNDHMLHNVKEAVTMNEMGMQALTLLKDKSAISNQSNEKVAAAIKSLDVRVNAITNIVDTITSIANQTNLLALNASIEAARAGEAGRGFAVVAEEIRKLAEDSSKATEEIRSIVSNIQTESAETVQVVSEVGKIAKEQNGAVENMNQSFVKIYEAVENITKVIEVITHEVDELNVQKNEIVEITSTISAVSEETAAATEEVSASMDEQTKAIEEVAKSAEHLNELSMELNKQIEVFKI